MITRHAKQRAKERLEINLNGKAKKTLETLIKKQKYQKEFENRRKLVVILCFNKKYIKVVYDKWRKAVITLYRINS